VKFVRPAPLIGRPQVSVAVPCYNYARYLEVAVRSALDQDGVDVEVVIIDDASTDDSRAVAARLAAADSRVTVLRHSHNQGHIFTFNEALTSGTADFVVKLDADDVLSPGQLARAAAVLQHHPDVGFVYGRAVTFTGDRPQWSSLAASSWTTWPGTQWLAARCWRADNVILQPEVMIRRSALENTGAQHRAEVPAASDLLIWLKIADKYQVARVNGADQGAYRVHDDSMQRKLHAGELVHLAARADAFRIFFAERPPGRRGTARLARRARHAVARETLAQASDAYDRGDGDQISVLEYQSLALTIAPSVRRSRAWDTLQVRRAGAPKLRRTARAQGRALRSRLRWQTWYRWGL
jgi:glycosyltransferase involved in cell wall biosynthesis